MAAKMPEGFLETADSILDTARVMDKIKRGSVADANIELNRDECQTLIWAIQVLRGGNS